ncbi:uncharacterized protein ARMOST_11450 [Armillaria ostoyae]|uniref:Uncharacterized protein n=1 Tax=Armillaria ostoyae TaxID=47428 RepID=A0A284RH62_ARMOS|nr:uncharacterized protein ARMOST_11450 [Armillaria ostoyae]
MSSSKPAGRTKRDPRYPFASLSLRAAPASNVEPPPSIGNQDLWNSKDSMPQAVAQKLGSRAMRGGSSSTTP